MIPFTLNSIQIKLIYDDESQSGNPEVKGSITCKGHKGTSLKDGDTLILITTHDYVGIKIQQAVMLKIHAILQYVNQTLL